MSYSKQFASIGIPVQKRRRLVESGAQPSAGPAPVQLRSPAVDDGALAATASLQAPGAATGGSSEQPEEPPLPDDPLRRAQVLLAKSAPSQLSAEGVVGRADEKQTVLDFLRRQRPGALYISGSPGTGKTLLLRAALDDFAVWCQAPQPDDPPPAEHRRHKRTTPRVVLLNCMELPQPADAAVVRSLLHTLSPLQTPSPGGAAAAVAEHGSSGGDDRAMSPAVVDGGDWDRLERLLSSSPPTQGKPQRQPQDGHSGGKELIVLALDEIDQLLSAASAAAGGVSGAGGRRVSSSSLLLRLFQLTAAPHSRLVLIGVANALDMTERFLGELASSSCEPEVLAVGTYTREQLIDIVRERLRGVPGVIDERALQLAAQRVAGHSGDIRKLLDLCRRALGVAIDTSRPSVSVAMMAPLVNSALGSDLVPLLRSLSLHEKLAAVALHRLDHRPPATPPQHPLLPPAPRQPPQQQQQQQSSSSPTTAGGSVPHEFPAVLAAYRSTCQMLSLPAADADVLRAALDALAAIGAVSRSAAAAAGRGGGGRRWTGGARGRATAGGPGGSGGEVSLRVSADDMKVAFEDLKLLQPLLLLNSK